MSQKRYPVKAFIRISKKIYRKFFQTTKKQLIWLLRTVFGVNKKTEAANAGFVLPTVVMVSIVVVLLTIAIMFRSFDRAKNASNVRVNQAVLTASTPALDRARAKLTKLFNDKRLPRSTPSDKALDGVLADKDTIKEYTFGDETLLELTNPEDTTEKLQTAWRFPVDTDSNGKFDSYTLYGIYYKNPELNNNQTQYKTERTSLQARSTPMTFASIGSSCANAGDSSASLVGVNGWFQSTKSLRLVKAFFVYTATVPITETDETKLPDQENYEPNKNRGFSALEYEQDKVQQSLVNNAVVYEDDLILTPGSDFRLNGRIITNSNFLTGSGSGNIRLYQVSSKASCFYDGENAKVTVGGNIASGSFTDNATGKYTEFDLFPGKNADPSKVSLQNNESVKSSDIPTSKIAYNNLAYAQRLNRLVKAYTDDNPIAVNASYATYESTSNDPSEVTQAVESFNPTPAEIPDIRDEQLEIYFRKRTRRVPFNEVDFGGDALGGFATNKPYQTTNSDPDSLRPIDAWAFPTKPTDGITETGFATLKLNTNGTLLEPPATEPAYQNVEGKEPLLGDRVRVGNNLPQLWWKTSDPKNPKFTPQFVGPESIDTQTISGIDWDNFDPEQPDTKKGRYRLSRVQTLVDVGSTDRDRGWELDAARIPENPQDPVGGLRVVTGAGIYLRKVDSTTTTDFTTASTKIWSDMMPVFDEVSSPQTSYPYWMYDPEIKFTKGTPEAEDLPYLKMRATAVYHYNPTDYNQNSPKPIACVSSFYDPTNSTTAKNKTGLPSWTAPPGFGGGTDVTVTGGKSNNGIVYGPPTKTVSSYLPLLTYQSNLKYKNERSIDDGLLKTALATTATERTLSQQSTIDAAICALQILDKSISPSNAVIPHGAIFETAFLDARQVKAIHKNKTGTLETFTNIDGGADPDPEYNLPLKDRQPLEIRATVLDMNLLRTTKIAGKSAAQEYLLPNSGIIYATRDDALPDVTAPKTLKETARKLESTVDYKLDPTRRPNAIMLVNGSKLWREKIYRDAEKGLILATNLPAYIKGNFNLHGDFAGGTQEEFTDIKLETDTTWNKFYDRKTLNNNFACREDDPRLPKCTTGDEWRSAAVIADAVTLLSNNFRLGFRNEGDYDWNNNLGDGDSISNRTFGSNKNFLFNTYAPVIPDPAKPYVQSDTEFKKRFGTTDPYLPIDLDTDVSSPGFQGSSYLNNFVTPVVRQKVAFDFVSEVCPETDISLCTNPKSWAITNVGNVKNYKDQGQSNWGKGIVGQEMTSIKTGSLGQEPKNDWANPDFPRRIAYQRDPVTGNIVTPNKKIYGVGADGTIQLFDEACFTQGTCTTPPPLTAPAVYVPSLRQISGQWQPILQINNPKGLATSTKDGSRIFDKLDYRWLQTANATTFNLIIAAGDTPGRSKEDNGGLHNYPRFLEHWYPEFGTDGKTISQAIAAKINGIFLQLKKSAYATAPYLTSLTTDNDTGNPATNLLYNTGNAPVTNTLGRVPFSYPPTRLWGYDVGLLSQSPDLFAQKLVQPVGDLPNEYFREVGKDDKWVQTLLCANKLKDNGNGTTSTDGYAIDKDQRPPSCQ
ncbi:hormogonium polysaccharide biosynthesis protein HpsA [Anabaena sp. PCC 7108]|uniref:hormogonium polysaccharide biosynthesis protein HpsA n=1 Tax=Anabaena sp. PCC 7108 TaxID=163908 RepID=UPI00034C03D9|nr:hormogonium polysaccharide biosynthesis protein HpsA [Anabaena sp. PCC 7108]